MLIIFSQSTNYRYISFKSTLLEIAARNLCSCRKHRNTENSIYVVYKLKIRLQILIEITIESSNKLQSKTQAIISLQVNCKQGISTGRDISRFLDAYLLRDSWKAEGKLADFVHLKGLIWFSWKKECMHIKGGIRFVHKRAKLIFPKSWRAIWKKQRQA